MSEYYPHPCVLPFLEDPTYSLLFLYDKNKCCPLGLWQFSSLGEASAEVIAELLHFPEWDMPIESKRRGKNKNNNYMILKSYFN